MAQGYGPGPLGHYCSGTFIIWKNCLSQICSRTIFEMHTAGVCLLYAPGAVSFSNMVLQHILNFNSSRLSMVLDQKVQRIIWSSIISRGQNLKTHTDSYFKSPFLEDRFHASSQLYLKKMRRNAEVSLNSLTLNIGQMCDMIFSFLSPQFIDPEDT